MKLLYISSKNRLYHTHIYVKNGWPFLFSSAATFIRIAFLISSIGAHKMQGCAGGLGCEHLHVIPFDQEQSWPFSPPSFPFLCLCVPNSLSEESQIAMMSQIAGLMCLRTDLLCLQNEVLLANFSSRHQLNCILNKWAALLANF